MGSFANGVPTKAFSISMAVLIIAVNIFGVLSYVIAIRSGIKSPAADGFFIVTVILLRLAGFSIFSLHSCTLQVQSDPSGHGKSFVDIEKKRFASL